MRAYPWLADHPHTDGDDEWPESNTVYVSRKQLRVDGLRRGLPGWGLFRDGYRLTASESGRAELEEYLRLRWMKTIVNGPAKRLLRGLQYRWITPSNPRRGRPEAS